MDEIIDEIMDMVYTYNAIIANINSWDDFKILTELIEKQSKMQYKIIHSIIEYCILNKKFEKPINMIVNLIYYNFFKTERQIIDASSFKTYILHLAE